MNRTFHAARRFLPEWVRKRVPPSLKRLLAPAVHAPVLGLSDHLPPGLPRRERKRALVSYITLPFRLARSDPRNAQFSNIGIARFMARALNRLGYIVDVADWTDEQFRVRRPYDLFIGHAGRNTPVIMAALARETVKIYFSSGLHCLEQNRREAERFDALERRRGVRLPADRRIEWDETPAYERADGIICVGNDRVRASFSRYSTVIALNNAAYPDDGSQEEVKDFESARSGFLFFSGPGNVHKGLDLLLEAFARLEAHLHVCQEIEPEFHKAFRRELDELGNIHRIGLVPARSAEFHRLAARCAWTILPSCAEGQPGGVVECMQFGLVPVVSRECNITTRDFGITLSDSSVAEIERTVKDLAQRPPEWCAKMSRRTRRAAAREFSADAFLQNMKSAIGRIVAVKTGETPRVRPESDEAKPDVTAPNP